MKTIIGFILGAIAISMAACSNVSQVAKSVTATTDVDGVTATLHNGEVTVTTPTKTVTTHGVTVTVPATTVTVPVDQFIDK